MADWPLDLTKDHIAELSSLLEAHNMTSWFSYKYAATLGARAQAQKLLKWLNDQMEEYQDAEPETHYHGEVMMQIPRDIWQEILEEVGL